MQEPVQTITAGGGHFGVVTAQIVKASPGADLQNWPKIRELLNTYCGYSMADDEVILFDIGGVMHFMADMADLFGPWVPIRWIREVMDACRAAPQHNYLFLTKFPEQYRSLDYVSLLPREDNFWYGTTVTHLKELDRVNMLPEAAHRFVSIEPMMSPIDLDFANQPVDWIIVGAETGNRKKKVKSHLERDWLMGLAGQYHGALEDGPEADYLQEKLDRRLEPIAGKRFAPFADRYKWIKKISSKADFSFT